MPTNAAIRLFVKLRAAFALTAKLNFSMDWMFLNLNGYAGLGSMWWFAVVGVMVADRPLLT